MLLACKFEEVNPLAIEEFVYISDNSYNKDEILRMESQVLRQLDFTLSASTSKARSPVWRGHPWRHRRPSGLGLLRPSAWRPG